MRTLLTITFLLISSWSLAQTLNNSRIDPDLIDPEMSRVMYLIGPKDIRITSYRSGHPSAFELMLCEGCQKKEYQLAKDAELLLDEEVLAVKDLAINLIKKEFDVIQLGIDRSNRTVTYLYLGGLSESSAEELVQEQSDEN